MENNMLPKWLVWGLGGLLIVLVAVLAVQKVYDLTTTFKNQKPVNTISVSGQGKVTAIPDLATINIGVLSQGVTAVGVKNQNNDKVNKIIAFVKAQGISDKDITTTQFSFYPQQNYPSNGSAPTITGYQGNQSITVKVHGVDKDQVVLGKILDGAVNSGANEINGVSLSIENPDSLQQTAQKQAIEAAKKKAQGLAQAAGLSLGKVVSVSESGTPYYPNPVPYALDSFAAGKSTSVAPDIQTGSQDITETMTVIFEVK